MPARTLEPAATFPNTGNLELPIAQLAFGDTGLAVAFFAINSFVQHTVGVCVTSRRGNRSQPWLKGVMFACLLAVVRRAGVRGGDMRLLIGFLAGALVIHLINLPSLLAGVMTLQFAMPVAVVNCIYV